MFGRGPSTALRNSWNHAQKDVVILHQFPRGKLVPNVSPFPLKLETFLRMSKTKYCSEFDHFMSAKGKCPWITMNGQDVADSGFAIEHIIQATGSDPDSHLSPEERAVSRAMGVMLNERFYWIIALNSLIYDQNRDRSKYSYPMFPKMVEGLFMRFITSNIRKQAHGHGIGRHSEHEVKQIAVDDLKAFSDFLGSKPYLMGDKPSTVDCSLFAFLCQVLYSNDESCFMQKAIEGEFGEFKKDSYTGNLRNLRDYVERMKAEFWPDWDEVLKGPKAQGSYMVVSLDADSDEKKPEQAESEKKE